MEKICMNCRHFVRQSLFYSEHEWGDCMNPKKMILDLETNEKKGVFRWANHTCDDFEPIKKEAKKQP